MPISSQSSGRVDWSAFTRVVLPLLDVPLMRMILPGPTVMVLDHSRLASGLAARGLVGSDHPSSTDDVGGPTSAAGPASTPSPPPNAARPTRGPSGRLGGLTWRPGARSGPETRRRRSGVAA